MKLFLQFIFVLFILGVIAGIYLQTIGDKNYHIVFGISILFFSFIVMPIFIYHRHQLGKYKKYQLDPKSKNLFKLKEEDLK